MHLYFNNLLASRLKHKRSSAGLMSVCGEILRDEKQPNFRCTYSQYIQPLFKQLPIYRDHLAAARVVRRRAAKRLFS